MPCSFCEWMEMKSLFNLLVCQSSLLPECVFFTSVPRWAISLSLLWFEFVRNAFHFHTNESNPTKITFQTLSSVLVTNGFMDKGKSLFEYFVIVSKTKQSTTVTLLPIRKESFSFISTASKMEKNLFHCYFFNSPSVGC